jgi:hypothetical protein
MDFNKYEGEPVYKKINFLGTIFPVSNRLNYAQRYLTFIKLNNVNTQDDFL